MPGFWMKTIYNYIFVVLISCKWCHDDDYYNSSSVGFSEFFDRHFFQKDLFARMNGINYYLSCHIGLNLTLS